VSNIKVRVTVGGGDVAMNRTADAQGRFEIESLPDATLDFEAHTEASGRHYYTNVSLTGPEAVTASTETRGRRVSCPSREPSRSGHRPLARVKSSSASRRRDHCANRTVISRPVSSVSVRYRRA
jgi:hypothetical protein